MATESSSSRSSSTADSYIGSLISLTSKSEIRYEGILYNINTEESSIGLSNVRSFGTEGRKKDGPQVPPIDKVYEYILFRGSDIKDLQVKSSPPAQQPPAPINNDPAIIQSHYPRPPSTSASLPSAVSGPSPDITSHNAQMGVPASNFQSGLPLYQPGGTMSWGASPTPSANASGLAMPMYWQGYYGPPNGLQQMHQQSLLRPPPGLSMPPTMQQPMHYPSFNANVPSGNLNLPESPFPLLPVTSSSISMTSSLTSSALAPIPLSTLPPETLSSSFPSRAPVSSFPAASVTASLPSLPPPTLSSASGPAIPLMSSKPTVLGGPTKQFQGASQSISSLVGTSDSVQKQDSEATSALPLITPGQLLQSGPTNVPVPQSAHTPGQLPQSGPGPTNIPVSQSAHTSAQLLQSGPIKIPVSQSPQVDHKDVEVVQHSSTSPPMSSSPADKEAQPPILPLPSQARTVYKATGAPYQNRHGGYRGRERGRGSGTSRGVTKFTEDFDFTAMNEKFNKDEVWGHLGKSSKSHSKDDVSDEDDFGDEDDHDVSKTEAKTIYTKDNFFDSLSCDAFNQESRNGRPRYSEQMKIDTETFGDFSRTWGGRGGRGSGRGGRGRSGGGGYYGRGGGGGYGGGYGGRGRGRAVYNRAP